MTDLVWTQEAVNDLESIRNYIARDSARYAELVVEHLVGSAERIARFPQLGRMVPEIGREELRKIIVGSYRVVYRVHTHKAEVLTVFRASRLFPIIDFEGGKG